MKNRQLHEAILSRLTSEFGFTDTGTHLRKGRCDQCKRKELWVLKESPWVVRCNRSDKCQNEFKVKEHYADLFENFNDRFKPTVIDPNATANAYMDYARGLDSSRMKGWYRQEKYWNPKGVGKTGTATVRFEIDAAHGVYMERFVETIHIQQEDGPPIARKQSFGGKYSGLWWHPPSMKIEDGDEVWLVEACIDAASLWLNGVKAVATLTCHNYPDRKLEKFKGRNIKWIWALDNDNAGRSSMRKHARRMEKDGHRFSAALIPQRGKEKKDFNDAHKADELSDKHLTEYKFQGKLMLAKTALDKALMIWAKRQRNGFDFEFNNRLFWFEIDPDKYGKAVESIQSSDAGHEMSKEELNEKAATQSGGLVEIANCYPEFLYFQVNALTDESWYYSRVRFPHGARAVKSTFTGAQLSAPTEFKKRLLSIAAGSIYTGGKGQLDYFLKRKLEGIKTVETVDYIGYSKEHGAYVFNDRAIAKGKAVEMNDEDYFELDRLSLKSLNQSIHLAIGEQGDYRDDWVQLVWQCFGPKGMIAAAFWFGSLFAEQIRSMHKSYPFLEIVGEPGAGKSTLVEFLWKLVGRQDYEGFDPSKSTLAARSRNFAQVSNLPVVLIEADRDEDTAKGRKFDWDELKTAYNGRASRARGVKTGGNETYEPPFRGSIVISQNADVSASEAILQRIVHLGFDRAGHNEASKNAAERLESMPLGHVSQFLQMACMAETKVMETVKRQTPFYEKELMVREGITSVRIAKNHAQILGLVDALADLVTLSREQRDAIYNTVCDIAVERQEAIVADHPMVAEFWEMYDFLNAGKSGARLNHSHDASTIAINFNHFGRLAQRENQQVPAISDLKRLLKASKTRKFKGIKTVRSQAIDEGGYVSGATLKCWIFECDPRKFQTQEMFDG
ncbi:MAG: toprim domain-containing protein [Parvibaculaceae bacterium]|nr:toprim domain-containing protein [Parvibaculaceae bacterium]